ncbi:MAG: cisplatin damage response ATP-dependent DNA ligase, partial [Pseudomonadota bacterium]|nr:cisplatin damage response ATP-dependent DNA ligase [Pseudomonadota bacterium]
VGDTAETIALLWPGTQTGSSPPRLAEIVATMERTSSRELPQVLSGLLDRLDANGRWALIKFLGGALRVGVSARLAKVGLAEAMAAPIEDIEEIWYALKPPFGPLFEWLEGRAPKPDSADAAVFRPVMLSHAIEDADFASLDPVDLIAEWKWDGIRVQIASAGDAVHVFSRAGDDIGRAFPDIAEAFRGRHGVLDGELLVLSDGEVRPFNDLQQRLNRRTVSDRLIASHPAHVRLYDILFDGAEDVRSLSLVERRRRLENWFAREQPTSASLSELVPIESMAALNALWGAARRNGIEGLMLKRRSSPYIAGRPKGHWFKWKRAPLTADCVLMYAQRGSGKRSSYYSDYTFGAWRGVEGRADELVPVGKAYSGFTDQELLMLDRWIRNNTLERFGPVRSVAPALVLEIAFDAVQASSRHKSGIAMRFPRVFRIRWDKPAKEADRLETLAALIPA